jgi:hypothetical protein
MTTNTDYSKKCEVLAKFWSEHKDNPHLADLVNYNNVGFPLAYMQEHGLCVPTENGVGYINETFDMLVEIVEDADEGFELISNFLNEHLIV